MLRLGAQGGHTAHTYTRTRILSGFGPWVWPMQEREKDFFLASQLHDTEVSVSAANLVSEGRGKDEKERKRKGSKREKEGGEAEQKSDTAEAHNSPPSLASLSLSN